MPKKFAGENSKAVAAKARKAAAKDEAEFLKEKQKEDEFWRDDDKHINKKLQRKEMQDKKKMEQVQKKAELKNLLESEEIAVKNPAKSVKQKVTRAQILSELEKPTTTSVKSKTPSHIEKPLEENINRVEVDGLEARSVTEAISILSTKDTEDIHPEKRVKAAYLLFEEANLPRLKEENPSLRLTQLKQMLRKEWAKSLENPMNQ